MDVSPYLVMCSFLLAMNRWVSSSSNDTYPAPAAAAGPAALPADDEELREEDG